MKAMTCEMCNSNELVKQDGMFVCQSCGTKYSIEEAKKLMIEGTVDIQGTVKVDHNDFVQNQLANARRAKQKEDWEETEKYYNLVEQHDPTNIEAIFYSSYAKARQSLVINDIYKRQSVFNAFNKSISVIDDNYNINDNNSIIMLQQITQDLLSIVRASFVYSETRNGYGAVTSDNKAATYKLFHTLIDTYIATLYNIEKKYGGDNTSAAIVLKLILACYTHNFNTSKSSIDKTRWYKECAACCEKIKAIDPTFGDGFLANQKAAIEQTGKKENLGCLFWILGIIAIGVIIGIIISL